VAAIVGAPAGCATGTVVTMSRAEAAISTAAKRARSDLLRVVVGLRG
jgi:hypothetical protein